MKIYLNFDDKLLRFTLHHDISEILLDKKIFVNK